MEKPIIFNTEMVKAILDGRKTQTRRAVKPQPFGDVFCGPELYEPITIDKNGEKCPGVPIYGIFDDDGEWGIKCHYQPGDILWVRETWNIDSEGNYFYRASEEEGLFNWKPSIHMPREAVRIFLRVTDVSVERLQEITDEGARAEGCYCIHEAAIPFQKLAGQSFEDLWDSIYAKRGYGWEKNPWVWVIEFKRLH